MINTPPSITTRCEGQQEMKVSLFTVQYLFYVGGIWFTCWYTVANICMTVQASIYIYIYAFKNQSPICLLDFAGFIRVKTILVVSNAIEITRIEWHSSIPDPQFWFQLFKTNPISKVGNYNSHSPPKKKQNLPFFCNSTCTWLVKRPLPCYWSGY